MPVNVPLAFSMEAATATDIPPRINHSQKHSMHVLKLRLLPSVPSCGHRAPACNLLLPSRHVERGALHQKVLRAVQTTDQEQNQSAAGGEHSPSNGPKHTAKQIVQAFYKAYNAADVDGVMELMAENAEYHDLALFQEPHKGQADVRAFFEKVTRTLPRDLNFAVDAISDGDPNFAGVKWHVDLNGNEFPFSRGCSFYEVNDEGKITAARDLVEPPFKSGAAALQAIALLAPVMRKLGPRANPGNLKKVPLSAVALWAFYVGYMSVVFFSTSLPGNPVYAIDLRTLQEVVNNSLNFFYVNPILNWLGIGFIPSPAEHPVGEALFNLVNAWTLMFWPLMLADRKGEHVKNKFPWYIASQFLTNVFFIPYMCLREQPPGSKGISSAPRQPAKLPSYASIIGGIAGAVGLISIGWALAVRPEFGGLAQRWSFAVEQATGNRVFFAFVLDAVLYSVWQAVLMQEAPARFKFVPFFGLAGYLLTSKTDSRA